MVRVVLVTWLSDNMHCYIVRKYLALAIYNSVKVVTLMFCFYQTKHICKRQSSIGLFNFTYFVETKHILK